MFQLHTDYYMRDFYDNIEFMNTSDVPVYIYQFSFFGKFNVYEKLLVRDIPVSSKTPDFRYFKDTYIKVNLVKNIQSKEKYYISESGACHADELPYLFYPPLLLPKPVEFAEPEVTVIKNMCSLWTNFAKCT